MNVNSFQDRENYQALPSNRPSITKQQTKHYQAIDQALPSNRSIHSFHFVQLFCPSIHSFSKIRSFIQSISSIHSIHSVVPFHSISFIHVLDKTQTIMAKFLTWLTHHLPHLARLFYQASSPSIFAKLLTKYFSTKS